MIKYIKNDFRNVRNALDLLVGKKIPFGIIVLYYMVVGLIVLPLAPFIILYVKIRIYFMMRQLKKWEV